MLCPKCSGPTKVVAFITEYAVVDRIIDHLKLTFVADKPPPSHVFIEVALMEAEGSGSLSLFSRSGGISCPDMICGSGFCGY
jgi:hypothetical protein